MGERAWFPVLLTVVVASLIVLAGCTGGTSGTSTTTTDGSLGDGNGPVLRDPPDRPANLTESTVSQYVRDYERARRANATIRDARNSSSTLRHVSVWVEARVVGRTETGGFLVESASSGGARYTDSEGRNVSADWGAAHRSLYYVTAERTRRVGLPRNWSTDSGRVVLVNLQGDAVQASFHWGNESVPSATVHRVDAGNASVLGTVNASATPKAASVSVGDETVDATVRVRSAGGWTETGVLVVVTPDGAIVVTKNYTML